MAEKHGNLSINSDNLFPIIKKWLYSDHDIFYRELISNGCDAITKLKKLDMMGEYELPADYKPQIQVIVNPDEKTLKFIDNGLGMTADEVEEYINQIAFSGATDFIEKYKDKANDDQIIGHFGLGFYSAFMVADQVTIDTLSYKKDATPVHWACDGGTEFDMTDGTKEGVGTEITLYLNEDCLEFANEYRAREVIEKYCSFMPTPIFLSKANAETEYETIDAADKLDTDTVVEEIHEEAKTEEKENENGEKEVVEVSPAKEKLKIVNFDNLPTVVIIDSSEIQTGTMASYNAIKNKLYIDKAIGNKVKLLELQRDAASPKNVLSTYVHEYIHWMDAQSYIIGHGEIIDSKEYLYWIRHKSRKKIDKLINKGYNINKISNYANNEYAKGKYDEMYTEYRVKKLLGE